jgi:uncharacterized protein (DUF302 family)
MSAVARETVRDGIVTKLSPRSVADTVARFIELANARSLKVFAVIDQRAEASAIGLLLRETVLIIFGDPAAGTPVMQAAPLSALDLPLKVLVWSDEGDTKVSYTGPDQLAVRHRLSDELAHTFDGIGPLTDGLVAP